MTIFIAILLFSFLIFIHELGHFVAAKLSGVQVNEFAMFMGPAIVKWGKGETQYSIRCIPIGGYCAMEGEDGDSDNPRAFSKAKWWKRLIILVAGAFMNFVVGFLIFAIIYMPANKVVEPVITEFDACCVFNNEEGLHLGDEIIKIDGERIYQTSDISLVLSLNQTETHDVIVKRDGKRVQINDLQLAHNCTDEEGNEQYHLGIKLREKEVGFFGKLDYVWKNTIGTVRIVRVSLQMLLRGQASLGDMTGPIGIVKMMSDTAANADSAKAAAMNTLYFGGFIAINLAVMNLLPFPALDGGRVVALVLTTAIEKITGKKLNPKYEAYIHGAGMVLLLALMAVIFLKDIVMLFKG